MSLFPSTRLGGMCRLPRSGRRKRPRQRARTMNSNASWSESSETRPVKRTASLLCATRESIGRERKGECFPKLCFGIPAMRRFMSLLNEKIRFHQARLPPKKSGVLLSVTREQGGWETINSYTQPRLTTVRQPRRQLGQLAMESLLKLMSGQDSVDTISVSAELIVRESTVPPREVTE